MMQANDRELLFSMVDGDFKKFEGKWSIKSGPSRFQRSWGMDPSFMPSRKCFERAGRYDIARALEKWGGLHEVSRLLSLKVRHPNRHANIARDKRIDFTESTDVGSGGKISSKPFVSQDTQKWVMKLKELDIDWAE
ncbi:hypothetical protein QYF36_000745 [Acer negundo]|nr:hypothetical protein QYF36_000745 [Acer negundo]